MKRKRKYIPLREKLAAALFQLLPLRTRLGMSLDVPHRSTQHIIAMFEWHHGDYHALGGSAKWHNLTPMLKAEHRDRTPSDIKTIAKIKRISAAQEEFRRRMLVPPSERLHLIKKRWPSRVILSRPFPKREE